MNHEDKNPVLEDESRPLVDDQINEQEAPENQATIQDHASGIGDDTKPMNDNPIPPGGLK